MSLAVRRAKAGERRRKTEVGGPASRNPATEEGAKAEARRQVEARRRKKRIEAMFAAQRRKGGDRFVDNWYPRGGDGLREDPHYGETSPEAPYGYVEGTQWPRREPLYDSQGRPIIPRPWQDIHRPERRGGQWASESYPGGPVGGNPVYTEQTGP